MYGVKLVGMSMPCSHWMYTLLSHISPAVMPQVLKTIYSETDTHTWAKIYSRKYSISQQNWCCDVLGFGFGQVFWNYSYLYIYCLVYTVIIDICTKFSLPWENNIDFQFGNFWGNRFKKKTHLVHYPLSSGSQAAMALHGFLASHASLVCCWSAWTLQLTINLLPYRG